MNVQRATADDWTPSAAKAAPSSIATGFDTRMVTACRRTFALDVLACPDCGGRLRLVATIADPRVIARILAHLGLPLEPPCPVPPRQLSWLPAAAT